jgi:hypothetical protein
MAGSPEQQDNRGFVEKVSTGVRNAGILAGLLGIIAAMANLGIGGPIFVAGVGTGVIGEVGRRAAGSGKK